MDLQSWKDYLPAELRQPDAIHALDCLHSRWFSFVIYITLPRVITLLGFLLPSLRIILTLLY